MANVVRDPRERTDAAIPDFSKRDPKLTFTLDDVAFVLGSRWKRRPFTRKGDDYFPLPAQWDITHARWLPLAHLPTKPLTGRRPFIQTTICSGRAGPLCDGCHSVNSDIETKSVTVPNGMSVRNLAMDRAAPTSPTPCAPPSVNTARLDYVAAKRHLHSLPLAGWGNGRIGSTGKITDWPVGFHRDFGLADYWSLEPHKAGRIQRHPLS